MNGIHVKILKGATHPPTPGRYEGDVGLDIYCALPEHITLMPGESVFIPGGFRMQFERGWAGLVLPRSSSNRAGLHVHTGVIDSGYTGEIGAEVRNIGLEARRIEPNDRIAQLVLIPAFHPVPLEVEQFQVTDRGTNGFGSTN